MQIREIGSSVKSGIQLNRIFSEIEYERGKVAKKSDGLMTLAART